MKQKLLTDIELDVHELKYLMDSFTKEPTPTLSELLKRSITRMQGRLDELQQEVDAVQVISPSAVEETAEEEDEVAGSEEDSPVIIQSLESVVVKEDEEGEAIVAEEKPVVIAAAAETAAAAEEEEEEDLLMINYRRRITNNEIQTMNYKLSVWKRKLYLSQAPLPV